MSKIEVLRDHNGDNQRVFVERRPLDISPVQKLQKKVSFGQRDFVGVPAYRLHMTCFDINTPDFLQGYIQEVNPGLEQDRFWGALEELVMGVNELKIGEARGMGEALDLFGHNEDMLVLRLQTTPELSEGRSEVFEKFKGFLASCGILDVEEFMGGNNHFKYQSPKAFVPHITLGSFLRNPFIPKRDVSGLAILLSSPRLPNVVF